MTKILTFSSQTQLSIGMGTCGENFGPLPCPRAILGPKKVSGQIPPPPWELPTSLPPGTNRVKANISN